MNRRGFLKLVGTAPVVGVVIADRAWPESSRTREQGYEIVELPQRDVDLDTPERVLMERTLERLRSSEWYQQALAQEVMARWATPPMVITPQDYGALSINPMFDDRPR